MRNICDRGVSFDDCELTILRAAVDDAEEKIGKRIINSPEIQKIIEIVENFIKKKVLFVMVVLRLIIFYQEKINFIIEKLKCLIMISLPQMH
jgi:hypothetical protein